MNVLIVLRGNSASGKSTVAKKIRELSSTTVAIIEQDYVRRTVMGEKEVIDATNIAMVDGMVRCAMDRGHSVILEGILSASVYGDMLAELLATFEHRRVWYFDVSFDETVRRHATKPIANVVSATDLRLWWKSSDMLGLDFERVIPEQLSVEEAARLIATDAGLPLEDTILV